MAHTHDKYYVPHGTRWPVFASMGLAIAFVGVAQLLNGGSALPIIVAGTALLLFVVFRWFAEVVHESESGAYNSQVDRSFRQGMIWFILSEVMFFACFFGALLYVRQLSLPWLGGIGSDLATHNVLWPDFSSAWPSNGPEKIGGEYEAMAAWGVPALNTAILLTSGVTLTIAHHALKDNRRGILALFLAITVALGIAFMGFQVYEYSHAYSELNLKLSSGVYGSTFFMLTGFHGLHVTIGAIMLSVMLVRVLRGHFTPTRHFAFEATAWYWHFVDVVWLGLFIFVYWL